MARLADPLGEPRGGGRLSTRVASGAVARRRRAGAEFFGAEAERIARLCHRMAERFARGGRLLALGETPPARSDAHHVAVEFVHPVIVGKRALPALAVSGPVQLLAEPGDIAIAFGEGVEQALTYARGRGCLTIGFGQARPRRDVGGAGAGRAGPSDMGIAEWDFALPSPDPFVNQELAETTYHLLWELVHVFFEHRGLLEGRDARPVHDSGASSFLYPFLAEQESDLEAVVADVRRSVLMKAEEIGDLRAQTLDDGRDELAAAAAGLRDRFERGGKLLAYGNGGSATDAMDVVADLRAAGRRALDLTEDAAIITAVANDIGPGAIFSRQTIAYGREGDAVLALSTSGNSENVIEALAEARRRGLLSIAMVGYDGGRVAAEALADHVVVTRSEHIPRIQEAQASAYHVLVEAVS